MPEPQFLTFREVAAITRLSERHLHRLVARGSLRPAREGRKLLFPRAEVDAWIAAKLAERPSVEACAS
ncbi:helix-turn-helix domain-containing protein [Hyphomonas polymorpha]|uniref:helix-turn-helix domain-containing protein n=1 Tax=Hyphomonas polymorpha TaxID=74319 RepID=UPI000A021ECD